MKKFYKIAGFGVVLSLAIFPFIPSQVVAEQKFILQQATMINQSSHKLVILSKTDLSNWNQTKTRTIDLASQIKVSPKERKLMSRVTQMLNEIDKLMLKIAELQKNVRKNKANLEKASFELKKYEKQVKRLQGELELQVKQNKIGAIGDDAQLLQLDLQNALQKQQQIIQMLSNISKVLHDTALAIMRKIK